MIRQKGERWYYTIDEYEGHKRIRHEHFGGFTKQECQKAFRAAMATQDRTGKFFEPSSMPVSKFMAEWMKKYVERNLKPNTVLAYEKLIENHINKKFGQYKLKEVTTADVQDYLEDLKETGLARSTLKMIYSIMKGAFRWAVAVRQYIEVNPMLNVQVPRYEPTPRVERVFNQNEVNQIFEHYPEGDKMFIVVNLAYYTGMRIGEILGLTWENVDIEKNIISVKQTASRASAVCSPKTASSIRDIPFPPQLATALHIQKKWQLENRLKAGAFYHDTGFVATHGNGLPITANDIRAFNKFCHDRFQHGSVHWFRHTHATRLLESGIDLDYVSKRLGHASIAVTANIYISNTDSRDKQAVNLMEKIL